MKIFKKQNKTIYIHIGFMKTGTSALQSFLSKNSKFLRINDIYFPEVNQKAMNYLGFSLLDEIPPYVHHKLKISAKDLYGELKREILKTKQNNIIITAEAFSLISTNYFLGENGPIKIREFLIDNSFNFKIIASVRRQDDYLISQYNQHVKTHNFYNLFHEDIEQFYSEKKELFDFNSVIKRWEKVFGTENIILNIYDKKLDSVVEFFKLFNLDIKSFNVEYAGNYNAKLSNKGMEFMRVANKYGINKQSASQNYLLIELIEKQLSHDERKSTLPRHLSNQVLKDTFEGNVDLSNRYFNANYTWFDTEMDDVSQENSLDTNELRTDEAIKVATAIWNYFQKKN